MSCKRTYIYIYIYRNLTSLNRYRCPNCVIFVLHHHSGSREAQALLFRHSVNGDLTGYVEVCAKPEIPAYMRLFFFDK